MGCKDKADSGGYGALGSVPMNLKNKLKVIDVEISVEMMQKCALLGSAKILRKVLEM